MPGQGHARDAPAGMPTAGKDHPKNLKASEASA